MAEFWTPLRRGFTAWWAQENSTPAESGGLLNLNNDILWTASPLPFRLLQGGHIRNVRGKIRLFARFFDK